MTSRDSCCFASLAAAQRSHPAALFAFVANLVFLAILHLSNRAVWSHGPPVPDVLDGQRIEIEGIRVLPVNTAVFADVLAVRTDRGQRHSIHPRHCGTISAGLLCRQRPCFPTVPRI